MKLFNFLYVLCLIGLIGAFCGANFGLSHLTDRLRCALNYDLNVDMKINDDGGGGAQDGAEGAQSGASPTLKFPQFQVAGVENLPTSENATDMLATILKNITQKLNGTEELLHLEDKLQRRVQALFADDGLRDTVLRNLGSANSMDILRNVVDERYLTTAVNDGAGAPLSPATKGGARVSHRGTANVDG